MSIDIATEVVPPGRVEGSARYSRDRHREVEREANRAGATVGDGPAAGLLPALLGPGPLRATGSLSVDDRSAYKGAAP